MDSFHLTAEGSYGGDGLEKAYYDLFIAMEFSAYERFWQKHVVPLTNRPRDISFKSDLELRSLGKDDEDICIAQLHYTVLWHLSRVYDFRQRQDLDTHMLTEALTRLVGAQDVAFELLERYTNRGQYDPWLDKKGANRREAKRLGISGRISTNDHFKQ